MRAPKRVLTALMISCLACMLQLPEMPAHATISQSVELSNEELSNEEEPARGGIGIRLVEIPANAQNDPRAFSYIIDNMPPGSQIQRQIEISNTSNRQQSVRMYVGGAEIANGSFTGIETSENHALKSWTSLERDELDLPPGSSQQLLVSIDVPAGAEQIEHYGVIWAEVLNQSSEGSNVQLASRVGIRVYLSVGSGNGPLSDFEIREVTAGRSADGRPEVIAQIVNVGGRALDISGELSFTEGPSGLSAGPFASENTVTVAPGKAGQVSMLLGEDFPNGPWRAELILKSGLISESIVAEITFPKAGEVALEASREMSFTLVILLVALLVTLLLIALIANVRLRRKRMTKRTFDAQKYSEVSS